jgi:hypothetical protein
MLARAFLCSRLPIAVALSLAVAPAALAQVKVTPGFLDFGERGHMEKPSAEIVLENGSQKPLTIWEMKPTCGCIQLEPPALVNVIPPGGSAKVKVSMGSGRAMGSLDKSIEISTSDPATPRLTIPAKMRVFTGFVSAPLDLKFDGVFGGAPVTQSVEVKRRSAAALQPFTLTVERVVEPSGARPAQTPSPYFTHAVSDIPGGKRIDLTLDPKHPEGLIRGEIEARLDGKPFIVPIAGEMFRFIKVVPTYFNFSRVAADDPSSFVRESKLSSTDGRPFKILAAIPTFLRSPDPEVTLAVEVLGEGPGKPAAGHTLRARIGSGKKALTKGSFSGRVAVRTDHPDRPELTLSFFGFFDERRK